MTQRTVTDCRGDYPRESSRDALPNGSALGRDDPISVLFIGFDSPANASVSGTAVSGIRPFIIKSTTLQATNILSTASLNWQSWSESETAAGTGGLSESARGRKCYAYDLNCIQNHFKGVQTKMIHPSSIARSQRLPLHLHRDGKHFVPQKRCSSTSYDQPSAVE